MIDAIAAAAVFVIATALWSCEKLALGALTVAGGIIAARMLGVAI